MLHVDTKSNPLTITPCRHAGDIANDVELRPTWKKNYQKVILLRF